MADTDAPVERRENLFLRWLTVGLLGAMVVLGGVIWTRVAAQVDRNTEKLAEHSLALQRLDLEASAERRTNSDRLIAIQAYLQAIGDRLQVSKPIP